MAYRDAPSSPPLVMLLSGLVIALDPELGTRRWQRSLGERPTRFFLVGETLMITLGSGAEASVVCLDMSTGEKRGSYLLGFEVMSGLSRGEHLILAGLRDAVCLTSSGSLAWSVAPEIVEKNAWNGDKRELVCREASGTELWRAPLDENRTDESGLLLGDLVAQPDLRLP